MSFYIKNNRRSFIKSEEDKQQENSIKYRLSKERDSNNLNIKDKSKKINNVKNSLSMKKKAIKELYLDENDFNLNEIKAKEGFQNRADIVNRNLKIVSILENRDNNTTNIKKKI